MDKSKIKKRLNSPWISGIGSGLVVNIFWKLGASLFLALLALSNCFKDAPHDNPNNGTSTVTQTVPSPSGKNEPSSNSSTSAPPAPPIIISHEPQQDSSITGTAQPAYIVDLTLKHSSPDIAVNKNVALGGKTMPYSIQHSCPLFCHENTGVAKIELNRKYGTFTAEIGVNQPKQTGTFIVIGDGIELKRYDITYGDPRQIEIDVTGVQLLELHTAVAGTLGGSPADMVRQGANAAGGLVTFCQTSCGDHHVFCLLSSNVSVVIINFSQAAVRCSF